MSWCLFRLDVMTVQVSPWIAFSTLLKYICGTSLASHSPSHSANSFLVPGLAGFVNITPVIWRYLACSTMIPECQWLPPPSLVGMFARIAMISFSRIVLSWFVSCPWILVTVSFLTSS